MKMYLLFITLILTCLQPVAAKPFIHNKMIAQSILEKMSLREKIGQKFMLDFRYWCEDKPRDNRPCQQDWIETNPAINHLLIHHHIGGIILFSNNLHDIAQMTTLTHQLQQTMRDANRLPLLIATDQEGGIVARLPRHISVTFPGNMALAAAHIGQPDAEYAKHVGKMIASDLKAVGINVNFAPDVDVNVNPLNPVINVRSFSDDAQLTAALGKEMSVAIQSQGIASVLKHFPGHGDTDTDSHLGLPVVHHSLDDAWLIDLYPFQEIIKLQAPDMIMTAHIQYPALDHSKMYAPKSNEIIITPATLSRTIQTNLLRQQLGFKGVTITDALDMGAISTHFTTKDAVIKAFQAGIDIALMPISISQADDTDKMMDLINEVETAVVNHVLSERELDESVLRIINLKIKLGLLQVDQTTLPDKITSAKNLFSDAKHIALEEDVTNDSVTLIQNRRNILPLQVKSHTKILILTPWPEQGAGIAIEIIKLQANHVLPSDLDIKFYPMTTTSLDDAKNSIDEADIVITANSTTKSMAIQNAKTNLFPPQVDQRPASMAFPDTHKIKSVNELPDAQFAYEALDYAHHRGKSTVFISLLAPYDLSNYRDVADVMLATYNFYGYLQTNDSGYFRGPSMPAITRILFGAKHAHAKLPVNIPDHLNPATVVYPRGFGLTT